MHWTDAAIVLSTRKHGETSAVVRVFARQHGVSAGVVRGIQSKTNRGVIQPGNIITATWQARLPEHLGTLRCELLEAHAAHLMQDAARLAALSSACAIVESALPERHPYPRLFMALKDFLIRLQEDENWSENYVRLELDVLTEAGFGLDLSACAATGVTDNLVYVSPKSGRAVSAEAGEPYREKLLKLPSFLVIPAKTGIHSLKKMDHRVNPESDRVSVNPAEILAGMELTGYFLASWLLEPHRKKLPAARARLMEMIRGKETVI